MIEGSTSDERRWMLLLTGVGGLMAIFVGLMVALKRDIGMDVMLVVDAARRVSTGQAMYTDPTVAQFGPDQAHYYGPPALAALYAPLTFLPDALIVRLALVSAAVLAVAGIAILLRASGGSVPRGYVAALLVGASTCYAILAGAALGNPSMLILPLLATAFLGLERDRPWLVGLGVGTAAALRIYPVVLLLPLLLAGRWKALIASVAVMAAWVAIGIGFAGLQTTVDYIAIAQAINAVPNPEAISTNGSLPAIVWRLGASDGVVAIARYGSIAIGAALVVISGFLLRAADVSERMIGFGVAIAGTLLLLATTWDHYYVSMIVIVVGIVLASRRAGFGLASVGLISAQAFGGLAMVWLPVLGLFAAWRRR